MNPWRFDSTKTLMNSDDVPILVFSSVHDFCTDPELYPGARILI
jgi:hypothetical protein